MRISRTWSGVVRINSDVMMQLMPLDLPAPVAPAMRRCGVVERSRNTERPAMSVPLDRGPVDDLLPGAHEQRQRWQLPLPDVDPLERQLTRHGRPGGHLRSA